MARKKKEYPIIENAHVIDITLEGKGIVKHDGLVIFVEGAIIGDIADVQITYSKKKYLEGKVVKLNTASAQRTTPYCNHFGLCGGCRFQHINYTEQLRIKREHVINCFQRLAKIEFPEPLPIIGGEETNFYRNKLQYSFSRLRWYTAEEIALAGDAPLTENGIGFHIPKRFDKVLDIHYCYHQPDPSNQIREAIRTFTMQHEGYSFYDVWSQQGYMRTITIRNTSLGEWMLIVQVHDDKPELLFPLLDYLRDLFPQISSLQYVINAKGNDTYDDLDIICYHGKPYITEQMEHLQFRIGPKSFFQTNTRQALVLYNIVRNFAELQGEEVVYDLYTGTGTIACFVANQTKQVIGLEYVPEAIEDAKINAALNRIDNTLFYAGDIAYILNEEFLSQHPRPDVVITDPPRAGMHQLVVDMLLRIAAPRIVYVSCNPATQARDLAALDSLYAVKKVQPVDMFPQTSHVETVVLLEHRNM